MKTSEKANMHNRTGLTAIRSARSVYLGGSGTHNEWHEIIVHSIPAIIDR